MVAALMILLANKVAYWEQREHNLLFANKCTLIRNQKSFTVPTIYNSQEHKLKLFS